MEHFKMMESLTKSEKEVILKVTVTCVSKITTFLHNVTFNDCLDGVVLKNLKKRIIHLLSDQHDCYDAKFYYNGSPPFDEIELFEESDIRNMLKTQSFEVLEGRTPLLKIGVQVNEKKKEEPKTVETAPTEKPGSSKTLDYCAFQCPHVFKRSLDSGDVVFKEDITYSCFAAQMLMTLDQFLRKLDVLSLNNFRVFERVGDLEEALTGKRSNPSYLHKSDTEEWERFGFMKSGRLPADNKTASAETAATSGNSTDFIAKKDNDANAETTETTVSTTVDELDAPLSKPSPSTGKEWNTKKQELLLKCLEMEQAMILKERARYKREKVVPRCQDGDFPTVGFKEFSIEDKSNTKFVAGNTIKFGKKAQDSDISENNVKDDVQAECSNYQLVDVEANVKSSCSSSSESSFEITNPSELMEERHDCDAISEALGTLVSMGFTNEGGWLSRLVEVKRGNVAQVLQVLGISEECDFPKDDESSN